MSENTNVSELICNERMRRLEDRVDKLDAITEELRNLTYSVQELTLKIGQMTEVQREQEARLSAIEDRDADMWRTAVKYVVTAVIGIVIGFAMKNIGF